MDDDFPEFTCKESIDALNMIKTLKNELASDEAFRTTDNLMMKFMDGNFLFLKFWYLPGFGNYKIAAIPGGKEGFSGSTIGGYNLGINDYITDEQKEAAVKAFSFLTSRDMQKNIVMTKNLYSGISDLYDDDEVCAVVDCPFFKSIQLTPRPKEENYNLYSDKFRSLLDEFLFGDKSAEEALNNVNNLKKVYYISVNPKDSVSGLIFLIACIVISLLMLLSLLFLVSNSKKPFFEFLPKDFWVISVLGSVLFLGIGLLGLGKSKVFKCQLLPLFLSLAFTLILIPVFYQLISNFPEENAISLWVEKHRYCFFFIFVVLDVAIFLLTLLSPYTIEDVIIDDGKNFQVCEMTGTFGKSIIYVLEIYKFVIIVLMLFLIFIEWNIQRTYYDLRFIVSAIYMNLLSVVSFIIVNHINVKDYDLCFILYNIIYIFVSLSNYIFIYGFRIIWSIMKLNNEEEFYMNKVRANNVNENTNPSHSSSKTNNNNNNNNNINSRASVSSTGSENINSKILNLHYKKTISRNSSLRESSVSRGPSMNRGTSVSRGGGSISREGCPPPHVGNQIRSGN